MDVVSVLLWANKMETTTEKIKRIQAEIAKLQAELHYLLLGDPSKSVSFHYLKDDIFKRN